MEATNLNTPSRRALLGALALSPIAIAVPALAEAPPEASGEQDGRQYAEGHDNGHQVGCEAFAFAWLAQFTDIGCHVYLDSINDCVRGCFPCFSLSVAGKEHARLRAEVREQDWFKALDPAQQQAIERDARSFAQHFWEGQTRALWKLLDNFPDGHDAVERIVRLVPQLGVARKLEA